MLTRCALTILLLVSCAAAQAPAAAKAKAKTKTPPTPLASKGPLVAEWKAAPQLEGNFMQGSMVVENHSDDDFDQTVLIEAVNEIGKAFAIGYQHFTLHQHSTSPTIPFSSTLPPGRYALHAWAIAEVPPRNAIHRLDLSLPELFVVTVI